MKFRVVLLGDSIRLAYQPLVAERLADIAEVWGPQDNCASSTDLLAHLDEWALCRPADLMHVNAGLHDIAIDGKDGHRVEAEAYAANVRQILVLLRQRTKSRLIWATITPVIDEWHLKVKQFTRLNADVQKFNRLALGQVQGATVNDLYSVIDAAGPAKCLREDGVHLNDKGNVLLADAVAAKIRGALAIAS